MTRVSQRGGVYGQGESGVGCMARVSQRGGGMTRVRQRGGVYGQGESEGWGV